MSLGAWSLWPKGRGLDQFFGVLSYSRTCSRDSLTFIVAVLLPSFRTYFTLCLKKISIKFNNNLITINYNYVRPTYTTWGTEATIIGFVIIKQAKKSSQCRHYMRSSAYLTRSLSAALGSPTSLSLTLTLIFHVLNGERLYIVIFSAFSFSS